MEDFVSLDGGRSLDWLKQHLLLLQYALSKQRVRLVKRGPTGQTTRRGRLVSVGQLLAPTLLTLDIKCTRSNDLMSRGAQPNRPRDAIHRTSKDISLVVCHRN
ncbi:hypothetical protein Q1695_006516 [Nippostrongylus brasiliensis]|nr:hypothetical protein Q1695_006516 [Nippostrongylus brasiliensis]